MVGIHAKRYFLSRHGQQAGPFTKEELRAMNITADTHVWNEELFDWAKAETFGELKEVFQPAVPVVHRGPLDWLRIARKRRS